MKKHEREELQNTLASKVLKQVEDAISKNDFTKAKELMKLYNQLDRGW